MAHPLASRPAITLYLLAALVGAPYALPSGITLLRWGGAPLLTSDMLKLLTPREVLQAAGSTADTPLAVQAPAEIGEVAVGATNDEGAVEVEPASAARGGLSFGKEAQEPAGDVAPSAESAPRPIEDPSGHALDKFFGALERVERKEPGSIARVTYYGDSVIASDWITSTLRRKMQSRFGDAGHGFILVADAWPGYHHDNISRFASKGWKVSRVVGPYAPDNLYGLGGVSFVADGPGMMATVGTAKSGEFGRSVSKFKVTYAEAKGGGSLSLKLDDEPPQIISTAAEETRVKVAEITAPDGPHKLEVRSNGGGSVRVFHVVLERDEPGVVVDAVGIIGCRLRFLDKNDDAHWAEELQRRDPQLITFTYGANESSDGFAYPMDQYEQTARAVLKQARDALPNASCLIVGPMDAAEKRGESVGSRQVVPAMNEIQRKLAAELGCGFFDTWQAMGGQGSMGRWMARGLGGADMIHPTGAGAEVIGTWVYKALMDSYARFKASSAEAKPAPVP